MTVLQWVAVGAAVWVGLSVPTALAVGPMLGRANTSRPVVSEDAEVAG